jgi:DNA-binding PucR family transcriptional regulator
MIFLSSNLSRITSPILSYPSGHYQSFAEAELLYSSQLTNQFNSNFFSQFQRVTVENLRIISKNQNLINFIGQNTYIWLDGSTQTESRSYTVENLGGELKITDSQFIKVIKFK